MNSRFATWLKRHRWPLALAGATLATRAVYLASVARDPFFTYVRGIPDAFFFNNWAQAIASGEWLGGDEVFFIGPLYAYFLGIIYRLIGPHLVLVRFVHVALEACSALAIYGFARRALSERAAKVAGVIWAVYLPAIFFSSFLLPVSLDVFLIATSFYLLSRGVEGRWWNFAGAGAFLGLAALDRTNLLVFVVAAVPLFLMFLKRLKWRRILSYFAPIAAIVLAATLRNGLVGGDFALVSSQGGLNFYIGNSAQAKGVYWHLGDVFQGFPAELNRDLATYIAEDGAGREMKPSEVSRWWFARGLEWLRENPAAAAHLYWRKLRYLVNDYEAGLNVDFYFTKFITPFHRVQLPWFGFVFPFGAIGLAVGWRKSRFARTAAALFVATYALSVLFFFVSARYRLPLVPIFMAFAGAGLVRWYDLWRGWRWRPAAALTAAAVALGVFAMWPGQGMGRDSMFGQAYYRYGKYYFEEGDYEKAVSYFYKSKSAAPEIYESVLMLALSYERLGRIDEALEMYEYGIVAAPHEPIMFHNYGVALLSVGRVGEAAAAFGRAVELDPGYWQSWLQLVDVYVTAGDYRRAELACGSAVELLPEDARVRVRHAELLLQTGKRSEAMASARAAIDMDPNTPGAHLVIGGAYYESGDFATAIEYFTREAELQPREPKVFGLLANSYLSIGDLPRARAAYDSYVLLGGSRNEGFEAALNGAGP